MSGRGWDGIQKRDQLTSFSSQFLHKPHIFSLPGTQLPHLCHSPDKYVSIHDTQSHICLATPTESPSSTPGLSLLLPPLSPPLRQVLTGPCCPGSPPTLTYSLPSWGNAELRGDLGRDCKTSGMWKTEEEKMEGPGPNPHPPTHTPNKHSSQGAGEKNKSPAMWRKIGHILRGVGR